jgi:hypothetical protein
MLFCDGAQNLKDLKVCFSGITVQRGFAEREGFEPCLSNHLILTYSKVLILAGLDKVSLLSIISISHLFEFCITKIWNLVDFGGFCH